MADSRASSLAIVPLSGRVIAIDIVRGFAILWVILYHLWTDIRFLTILSVQDTFRAVPNEIAAGTFPGSLTAVSDAFLRVGNLGVPLFMMLSGLSLTLVAMRRDRPLDAPRFVYQRFRRVMIPYWVGFVWTLAFAAVVAFVQWQRLGGEGFLHYYQHGDVKINGEQLLAGALLVPRMFANDLQFAPEGSLWFVVVILQYYLLFPLLLPVLKRIGPWLFLAAALAITLTALNIIVAMDGNLLVKRHLIETAVPFRIFEFALGMTAGYLMVERPAFITEYLRVPLDIAGIVFIGGLLFIGGVMLDAVGVQGAFQVPMVVLGMTLIVLPLIAKTPGLVETTAPGRIMAWVGVISYTVLIVNEPLRSVTHHMTVENAGDRWMFLWVGVLYIPLTLLVARPLAVLLGLVDRAPKAGAVAAEPPSADTPALHA